MATVNSTLTLNDETIAGIRDALLIGLAAFGEIKAVIRRAEIRVRSARPNADIAFRCRMRPWLAVLEALPRVHDNLYLSPGAKAAG